MNNFITIALLALIMMVFQGTGLRSKEVKEPLIIRRISLAHCAKGPVICAKCKAMDRAKYCLLKLCTPDGTTRRVIEVTEGGKKVFREFEVVKIFDSKEEAQKYSQEHSITDALWEEAS
jgi:hypothetical protein